LQTQKDGTVLLSLYVQPRAGKNELAGIHDGVLKIRLTAPPVDGRANKAVVAFLSKTLRVSKSALVLTSGLKNRRKQIKISGLDEQSVRRLLSIS
jgi:uncharacterized protein (TIGR00251 family)